MNHKEKFTYVYDNKVWGDGSGGGSNIDLLGDFVEWINSFIKEKQITSLIDYGCGMSGLGEHIHVSYYLGLDCVESVVNYCNKNFNTYNRSYNLIGDDELKFTELLLVKDVLCHWNYDETYNFLSKARHYCNYIILVNSCNQSEDFQPYNSEPHLHGLGLSYQFQPLKSFNPELIMKLEKNPNDPKEVLLISNI